MIALIVLIVLAGWFGRAFASIRIEDSGERFVLRFSLGLTVCATLAMGIGSLSLYAVQIAFGIAAAGLVGLTVYRWRQRRDDGGEPWPVIQTRLGRFESVCLGAAIAANMLTFLGALAPVTSWDAATAHLAVPQDYTRLDGMPLLEGNVYSAYPQFMHALFTYAYAQSGETAAALVSWGYGVLGCVAVFALAKRIANREAGFFAAAIFATAPIYFAQTSSVAIDVAFTSQLAAALLALSVWSDTKRLAFLVPAGVLIGAACGIRHTGLIAGALLLPYVAIRGRGSGLGVYVVAAGAAALPWLLRTFLLTGNPVYPLLPGVFGWGPLPDVQVVAPFTHETARSASLLGFLTFPWRVAMHPASFDGWEASGGAAVMALGPLALFFGGKRARSLASFGLVGVYAMYAVQRFARYLLPFFMPLQVAGAAALVALPRYGRVARVAVLATVAYGLVLGTATIHFKIPAVLGSTPREEYLESRVERYPAFQWIRQEVGPAEAVLSLDPRGYYIYGPSFTNLAALEPLRNLSIDEQKRWMREREIRYILIPEAYLAQSPVFAARGIDELVEQWYAHPESFRRVYDQRMPEPSGERVVILEVIVGVADEAP